MPAIDLRARPPIRPFTDLPVYASASGLDARLLARGYEPPRSFISRSWDGFVEELTEAGLDGCFVHARLNPADPDVNRHCHAAIQDSTAIRGFVGAVSLDESRIQAQIEECAALGALGISLEPGAHVAPKYANDPTVVQATAIAAEHGLVVFIVGGDSGALIEHSNPRFTERLAQLVPAAQIVIVHGGWPWVREAIAITMHRSNIWLMPDMYSVRFPGSEEYISAANGLLRDRMLFASSYPSVNLVEYVSALWSLGLAPAAWAAMTDTNQSALLSAARG